MSAAEDDYGLAPSQPLVTEIAVCLTDPPASVIEAVVAAARDAAGSCWRGVAIGNRLFANPEDDSGG